MLNNPWAYITTHEGLLVASPIRQLTEINKKNEKLKVKQSVYIGVYKGAEFKNNIYFVLRSLLHCVLA